MCNSKQVQARRSGAGLRSLVAALIVAAGLVPGVRAEYTDPLDLPALEMAGASRSLLLDVTRAGQRLVAVGERGHILLSDDEGATWTQASVPASVQLNAVTFVDERHGWAVGEDGLILHTRDGGQRWQKQLDLRDADQKGPLLDVEFTSPEEGYAVGVFSKLYRTADAGQNWVSWDAHADNPDAWHFFAIATVGSQTIYITSEVGLLFRSVDGGEHFEPMQTPHEGSFHGVLARAGENGRDELVLFGVGGKLFVSGDGGENWANIETGTTAGLSGGAWLADGSAMLVGADGVLLKVAADLGSVHRSHRENGLPLSSVLELSDGGFIFVGLGGIQSTGSPANGNAQGETR